MPRMALGLAYDGSFWQGWQTQPGGLTVQDKVESALARFLDQPVSTICAGRTDTGVHALEQVVHLDTQADRRLESWVRGLNALLPDSIAVQWAKPVSDSFHARFSAISRSYIYIVRNTRVRSPLMHGRVGWVYHSLRLAPMRDAARRLIGEHDFSSFRSSQCQAASPVRTMQEVSIEQYGDFYLFKFRANAFLHHMIRNLMGALLYVGQGKQEPDWMDELLAQRDRRRAAPTFSPAGLYLSGVEYPDEHGLPSRDASQALLTHVGLSWPTI
ncbi:tRNA pseudouridine(38-40) synthase TruA [Pollutimonas harenae]|uniref:tRNA pseudouridine synthase A n=1 Tax=Pollutimonas harenae TaxID=657015 RepID=A0A853GUQ2_9BURK|nr:tRNA pseudouridine(38-40) synthase TruA [Pollutimonas harenae]NYT85877.1 tRNA pseudouridine(38-40) synthase TruA [Pollutimonas harenae]TEA70933.1 tRNA pseudouridine(38-40) synthase TruA [Pollutimonas harenae]